ncbi:MAG: glycosyltransferase family 39 protein [Candidatus Fermentibacteria bacterium]|nr:glycosyltransferase family 39 protein [Candidatus Fermentibacteria bacterium]
MKLNSETRFVSVGFTLVAVLYILSLSIPLFGDSLGYGYKTTDWIRSNGFTPFAAGSEKGEQAMGHPTLFFWMWALLSGVFGNSLWVARLLPAIATFISIWGMYRLGRLLSCELAGWLSALALFASPLFVTQAMRPMPESAVIAAVVWSLYFYVKRKYVLAVLLCALGIIFREQAIFLAVAYFLAEIFQTGFKKPLRLLLFLSPTLVIAVTGLINLLVNGYFFFPTYMGEGSVLESNWLAIRLRLFGSHLISEDFRWLPVTVALAGMIRGIGRDKERRLLPFILILIFPTLFFPPDRILFLVFVTLLLVVYKIRHRLVLGRVFSVFILMPVSIVLFHVLIVLVSPDSALNLFRYVLPAYPIIILGSIAMLFKYYSHKTAFAIGAIFVISTAVANRSQHYDYQFDTSLACVKPLLDHKEAALFAASLGDTVLVSEIDDVYFSYPECGIVDSPIPFKNVFQEHAMLSEGVSYTMVIASFMLPYDNIDVVKALLPPGSELRCLENPRWDHGRYTIEIYRVEPVEQ